MRTNRAWSMPEHEALSLLRLIKERIRSSEIEVQHRDALIRLRQVIEEELVADGTWTGPVNESDRHAA